MITEKAFFDKLVALPMLVVLLFLLVLEVSTSREALGAGWLNGVPFQQTTQEIIDAHYNMCKNKIGPNLTREDAATLDAYCVPIPARPQPTAEELEFFDQILKYQGPPDD